MSESSRGKFDKTRPAIVAAGYNRESALRRLLKSLSEADYEGFKEVTLIISLDNGGPGGTYEAAEEFRWKAGEKIVLKRPERLGLKQHMLSLGDLTGEYGSIILLEDDLYVSPFFYHYTCKALERVQDEPSVGGISLYDHRFNVFKRLPFDAVDDGFDNFYLRFPSSWGQAWNADQWKGFREWLKIHDGEDLKGNGMPSDAAEWGESSWLKYALKYSIDVEKDWLYPRISYTTNFFDQGEHSKEQVSDLQVPLSLGNRRDFVFSLPETSSAKYDQYFENRGLPYQADIYGLKRRDGALDTDEPFYSAEILEHKIRERFGLCLRPVDSNILFNIEGEGICLYEALKDRENVGSKGSASLERYFYPGLNKKKILKLVRERLHIL